MARWDYDYRITFYIDIKWDINLIIMVNLCILPQIAVKAMAGINLLVFFIIKLTVTDSYFII